jgi:hypothetical protein
MSLFGIESEADCRKKLDALLEFHDRASAANNKEAIGALKSELRNYYDKGDTIRGESQMSPIEKQYFWPAVLDAYVFAPKLSSPRTWSAGLDEIQHKLRFYRPKER